MLAKYKLNPVSYPPFSSKSGRSAYFADQFAPATLFDRTGWMARFSPPRPNYRNGVSK